MKDEKNTEIQDDETLNETSQTPETEATPSEEQVKETAKEAADDNTKRHFGRHAREKELKKTLEEEKGKLAELNDKYLRLFSEFDNFRKRTAKEKIEMAAWASEGVVKEMLPVLDDFERAMQNMEKNGNEADVQGVQLIYNKLKNTLKAKGLEEIEAMGQDFNTDEHEALTLIPAPDEASKNKVMDVIQKGYKLNGKVIRFARVVVGN